MSILCASFKNCVHEERQDSHQYLLPSAKFHKFSESRNSSKIALESVLEYAAVEAVMVLLLTIPDLDSLYNGLVLNNMKADRS